MGASMQPSGVRHDVTRTTKAKAAITKQTLGQCIAEKRCGCGMPQEALAEQLNVTPQAVSKWENDAPCTDVLLQLARLLGITVDELLIGDRPSQVRLAGPEERVFDMRQVLQLTDGGVVGQLLQVDVRDGTHMELWVD